MHEQDPFDIYREIFGADMAEGKDNLDSLIVELVETAPYGITRRGIFYKTVSAGFYPGTHDVHYKELGKVLKRLRKAEKLNEGNIIDGTRIREDPYVFGDPGRVSSRC